MAYLDAATGRLVVRIAYDGPPLAGKTATLRALGEAMSAPVASFEEAYGRTMWFDWMNYRGGMYGGESIECEVVALPGQNALQQRREKLLRETDAVVFVADVSPAGHGPTVEAFRRLVLWYRTQTPSPGLVVQANKQDLPGAWDRDALRERLGLPDPYVIVESVATGQLGIRQTFVYAVREAVRRAELIRADGGVIPAGSGVRNARDVIRTLWHEEMEEAVT